MNAIYLKEFINYLFKRLYLIILFFVIFTSLGIVYVKNNNKVIYKTESSISVFSLRNNSRDLYVDNLVVLSCANMITNDEVINNVIKNLNLNTTNNDLKNMIVVNQIPNSGIINIIVKSTNKDNLIKISNEVLNEFDNYVKRNFNSGMVLMNILTTPNNISSSNTLSTKKYIIMFSLIGIILGFGIILIKYYFDDKIKSIEYINKKYNINSLILKQEKDYDILINNLKNEKIKSILITNSQNKENKNLFITNLLNTNIKTNILFINIDNENNIIEEKFNIKDNSLKDLILKYNKKKIQNKENIYFINNKVFNIDYTKFNDLLSTLENEFDLIIINGYTLEKNNDSTILSKICNKTILLCELNKVNESLFDKSFNSLNKKDVVVIRK